MDQILRGEMEIATQQRAIAIPHLRIAQSKIIVKRGLFFMRKTDIIDRRPLEKLSMKDIIRIMDHSVSTCERYRREGDLDRMDLFWELICDAFCVGYMMGNRGERLSGNRGKRRA